MYEAVIFDWDGTLWDASSFIQHTYSIVFSRHGMEKMSVEMFRKKFKHDWRASLKDLGLGGYEDELEWEWRKQMEILNPMAYDWVKPLLEEIKSKVPTAIVSSAPKKHLLNEIRKNGLVELFNVVLGAEDVKAIKPDPTPLLIAAKKLDANAKKCLYVGDMVEDARACENAGIDFVAVEWGIHDETVLKAEKHVFFAENPLKLGDFIKESL